MSKLVPVLLYYFRFWARLALKIKKPIVIGITGSVGKSSTRNALSSILKDHSPTLVVAANTEIGLPLGILGLQVHSLGFQTFFLSVFDYARLAIIAPFRIFHLRNYKYVIVEMGIDAPYPPRNMGYLLTIVKPDIAILLNAHPTHTQEFGAQLPKHLTDEERRDAIVQRIADEKGRIITESGCTVGIYNADNHAVLKTMRDYKPQKNQKLLTFGSLADTNLQYRDYKVDLEGTEFAFNNADQVYNVLIKGYILPKEYQEVFASALLVADYLHIPMSDVLKRLQQFHLPSSRASLFHGTKESIIIDSSYNASKAAVLAFLDLVYRLKGQERRPVVFLFGDMRELGDQSQIEHEEVADKIIQVVDYLYCVGEETKQFVIPRVQGKLKEVKWFEHAKVAGNYVKECGPEKAIILVKGSQNTIFLEEAVKELLVNKEDAGKVCRQSEYWLQKKGIQT